LKCKLAQFYWFEFFRELLHPFAICARACASFFYCMEPKTPQNQQTGRGNHLTPRERELLIRIGENLETARKTRKRGATFQEEFEMITGLTVRTLNRAKKSKSGEGVIPEATPRGPKPLDMDEKFAGFYDWVSEKIYSARKGGYLTLRRIKDALVTEKEVVVSLRF
jgi:hypothetical protein